MAYSGYQFYIDGLELPYAPSELKMTIGGNNKTVNLLNGVEINVLKSPKLTEIEFEIELPRGQQYPFANKLVNPKTYTDHFEKIMVEKRPIELVIIRPNYRIGTTRVFTNGFYDTVMKVSLEKYELIESADNGFDIKVPLKFKKYVDYGVVKKVSVKPTPTKKAEVKPVVKPATKGKEYVVKKGDCLWNIAKKEYGTGTLWKKIFNANKTLIDNTARKYGKKDSCNGHWIYPGTKLTIPPK